MDCMDGMDPMDGMDDNSARIARLPAAGYWVLATGYRLLRLSDNSRPGWGG